MPIPLRRNNMKLQARDYVVSLKLRAEQLEQARQDALAQNNSHTVRVITTQLEEVDAKWRELFTPNTEEETESA